MPFSSYGLLRWRFTISISLFTRRFTKLDFDCTLVLAFGSWSTRLSIPALRLEQWNSSRPDIHVTSRVLMQLGLRGQREETHARSGARPRPSAVVTPHVGKASKKSETEGTVKKIGLSGSPKIGNAGASLFQPFKSV